MTTQPATHITLRKVSQYGIVRRFPTDPAQAKALEALTGKSTLLPRHMDALLALGITFSEVDEP